jgi:hypothetical protein
MVTKATDARRSTLKHAVATIPQLTAVNATVRPIGEPLYAAVVTPAKAPARDAVATRDAT